MTPVIVSRRLKILLVALVSLGLLWQVAYSQTGSLGIDSARAMGQAPPHTRPLVKRDGKLLLWASGDPQSNRASWFDMTGSLIDPASFQYGIGKDRIASIDEPVFVDAQSTKLRNVGINDDTFIIGYASEGDARAYPVQILDRHEVVNDEFGGAHLTVAW